MKPMNVAMLSLLMMGTAGYAAAHEEPIQQPVKDEAPCIVYGKPVYRAHVKKEGYTNFLLYVKTPVTNTCDTAKLVNVDLDAFDKEDYKIGTASDYGTVPVGKSVFSLTFNIVFSDTDIDPALMDKISFLLNEDGKVQFMHKEAFKPVRMDVVKPEELKEGEE